MRDGKLKGKSTEDPHESPLAENDSIKGVWFLASLYQGELPTRSPYGTERINIPISTLMTAKTKKNWKLFFESSYCYYKDSVHYVRLILGNKDDCSTSKSMKWCQKKLHEIDLADNQFLCWKKGDRSMKVLKTATQDCASIYTEVLILGDLDIPIWDTVTRLERAKDGAQPIFEISSNL